MEKNIDILISSCIKTRLKSNFSKPNLYPADSIMMIRLSCTVLIFTFFLASCNKDVTIIGNKKTSFWHVPFTQVLFKTIKYANGTSQGMVKLQVFNSNNDPIEGLFLNGIPQTNTANFVNCTQSNAQGIVYCFFTSTIPSTTDVDFTDGAKTFTTDIAFIPLPVRLDVVRVSNTKIIKQDTSGVTSITGLRKTSWLNDKTGGADHHTESPYYRLNLTTSY